MHLPAGPAVGSGALANSRVVVVGTAAQRTVDQSVSMRSRESFDAAWRITRHDPAALGHPLNLGGGESLGSAARTGTLEAGRGFARAARNYPRRGGACLPPDSDGTTLRAHSLPNDRAAARRCVPAAPGEKGKLPWWYWNLRNTEAGYACLGARGPIALPATHARLQGWSAALRTQCAWGPLRPSDRFSRRSGGSRLN
jgi:hypothetical protein